MKTVNAKAYMHPSYITLSVIAFLLPLAGLILGIVYLTKDKAVDRKLGEHLVALSILFMLLGWFFWVMLTMGY